MTQFDLSKPTDQAAVIEMIAAQYGLYPEIAGLLTEAAGQIEAANEWQSLLPESRQLI